METSDISFKETFQRNLARLRQQKEYNQVELSEKSGFEASYVGKLERGEATPSFKAIHQLCETLSCSPQQLLLPEESRPDPDEENAKARAQKKVHEAELQMQSEQLNSREEDLQQLQAESVYYFSQSPIPSVVVDAQGIVQNANQQFQEEMLPQDEQAVGEHVNVYLHPEDRDDFYRFRHEAQENSRRDPEVFRFLKASDEPGPYEVSVRRIGDSTDQNDKLLMMVYDVSRWIENGDHSD